ncbi:uncharacterized protein DUF1877 [Micromonospora palomenae]|uniref:Uncharacterized protein DUF1877 n=1 Tax=Micromonospora palomenae TaxID=1461247 RepID=A0A561VN37_9ACTN|nr:DUF1877 family protein [Micromonospora palomenae]TWG13010.1 uncharacterized protein DUF1877 [Micromonospora palomenae]
MSFYMRLRATASNEVPEDFSSLLDFMSTAWEAHQEEHTAGIADSIDKDFGHVHELYTTGADHGDTTNPANTLPIFGGRHMHSPTEDQPPFVILTPAEVRRTALFLRSLPFDERWQIAGTKLSKPYIGWEDKNAARSIFLGYHNDLRTFYERATRAGHAVIKAFWY